MASVKEFENIPFPSVRDYKLSLDKKLESLQHQKILLQQKIRKHKDGNDFLSGSIFTDRDLKLLVRAKMLDTQISSLRQEIKSFDHRNESNI